MIESPVVASSGLDFLKTKVKRFFILAFLKLEFHRQFAVHILKFSRFFIKEPLLKGDSHKFT